MSEMGCGWGRAALSVWGWCQPESRKFPKKGWVELVTVQSDGLRPGGREWELEQCPLLGEPGIGRQRGWMRASGCEMSLGSRTVLKPGAACLTLMQCKSLLSVSPHLTIEGFPRSPTVASVGRKSPFLPSQCPSEWAGNTPRVSLHLFVLHVCAFTASVLEILVVLPSLYPCETVLLSRGSHGVLLCALHFAGMDQAWHLSG